MVSVPLSQVTSQAEVLPQDTLQVPLQVTSQLSASLHSTLLLAPIVTMQVELSHSTSELSPKVTSHVDSSHSTWVLSAASMVQSEVSQSNWLLSAEENEQVEFRQSKEHEAVHWPWHVESLQVSELLSPRHSQLEPPEQLHDPPLHAQPGPGQLTTLPPSEQPKRRSSDTRGSHGLERMTLSLQPRPGEHQPPTTGHANVTNARGIPAQDAQPFCALFQRGCCIDEQWRVPSPTTRSRA